MSVGPKVAMLFGTRVTETILARVHTSATTGRTYECKRSDQTLLKYLRGGGRPDRAIIYWRFWWGEDAARSVSGVNLIRARGGLIAEARGDVKGA